MASYSGKNAVIIGGSHGIGLSTAQLLVDGGAKVLVTGRSLGPIEAAKQQLKDKAEIVPCDITSTADISDFVQTAQSFFGPGQSIDLLFVNAGYASLEPFSTVSEDSFRRTFDTNVFGAFFVVQKLSPLLKDGGSIVFTTAVSTQAGIPGMATYSASKAAVRSLVQTLAAELVSRKIRVNAVSPGFVKTPTMGIASASSDELREFENQGVQTTPLGRIGEPIEIARAVLFLAFEATFTTGSEVTLDGGLAFLKAH
ncbi:short chain dehydrogenase [Aspergillus bombycis]|uniref:Short chain dehydrogenase n=1 Tax=Aspergillus bombycis TaxID=109264 RepID=A0A1F7ZJZ7_9EURO|nr:short chain dehydrogenase [Aspergillus bombycis]OGM39776.1 short chain dehydrogenase [Aspergillus bombycis]